MESRYYFGFAAFFAAITVMNVIGAITIDSAFLKGFAAGFGVGIWMLAVFSFMVGAICRLKEAGHA